jgi:hypothetical protein
VVLTDADPVQSPCVDPPPLAVRDDGGFPPLSEHGLLTLPLSGTVP